MRNSLIAIIAAAAVAGMITFMTEPTVSAKSGIPQSGDSGISQPAVKGDRLDLRPREACSLPKNRPNTAVIAFGAAQSLRGSRRRSASPRRSLAD